MKITLISKSLSSKSAADSFEIIIGKKFADLLALSDKQKAGFIEGSDDGDSNTFVDTQEVATLEFVKVKGDKITIYPAMDLLDGPMSSIKTKMQRAFDKWASSLDLSSVKKPTPSKTRLGSPSQPIVVNGGKVSYQKFEDSCLYDEPKENGRSITRKFTVLTAVNEADQFSDGNSFAGCWFTTKRGNQLRTFVLTTKQACKPTNVKFSNLKKFVVFEVKNKKELYDGKATVIGDVHTADGVEVLLNAV